jgi:hypothetical protein
VTTDSTVDFAALLELRSWDGLVSLEDALRALQARPNFFTVVGRILKNEAVHSDMLRWLLDPTAWHGLGDGFARRFVKAVLAECGQHVDSPVEVDQVHREFSTGRGPIDLLVTLKPCGRIIALGIENKIDSPESERQLVGYGEGLEECFGQGNVAIAFLTPGRREPNERPKCPFASVGYQTVTELLDAAISAAPPKSGGAIGLQLAAQYLDVLRTNVMKEPTEIDRICSELYKEHPRAWQALRRRLPSERDELHARLGLAICRRFTQAHQGEWRFSVRREDYTRVYRPAWRKLGTSEDDLVIGLSESSKFYDPKYAAVHLRVGIDTLGDEAGERFRYRARIKVHTKQAPADLREAVRQVLGNINGVKVPDRDDQHQFMIPVKSTSRMPSVDDRPDNVVDWIMGLRRFEEAVKALDSVLGKE